MVPSVELLSGCDTDRSATNVLCAGKTIASDVSWRNALNVAFPVSVKDALPASTANLPPLPSCVLYGVHTVLMDLTAMQFPVRLIPLTSSLADPSPSVIEYVHSRTAPPCSVLHDQPLSSGNAWLDNHYRLVAWKLAAQERTSLESEDPKADIDKTAMQVVENEGALEQPPPARACCRHLSYQAIVLELGRRIMRELSQCRRPCLALILERDAAPSRFMVLCVADVQPPTLAGNLFALTLTDGWYTIPCQLDAPLSDLVRCCAESDLLVVCLHSIVTWVQWFGARRVGDFVLC